MPFLRVIRDKRGYETTLLMDWYRDGTRQRSRILYVFRTPGGVRVGRASLEPEVLRQIEGHYPNIAFNWKAVLDTRQVIDAVPEHRRPPVRRREEEEEEETTVPDQAPSEGSSPAAVNRASPSRPPIPAVIEGVTPDEQTAFLLHWFPVARERVAQRTIDPVRRDALLALADQLNPTAWTTADEVAAGLLQASEALERLSRVLTRRRRRSGRSRPGPVDSSVPTTETDRPDVAAVPTVPGPNDLPTPGE